MLSATAISPIFLLYCRFSSERFKSHSFKLDDPTEQDDTCGEKKRKFQKTNLILERVRLFLFLF